MNGDLGANAQAILVLTAPLIAGKQKRPVKPLTVSEYRDLSRHLHETSREPADLLDSDTLETLSGLRTALDSERLHLLLGRGFLLAQAMERWRARAIWVVTGRTRTIRNDSRGVSDTTLLQSSTDAEIAPV